MQTVATREETAIADWVAAVAAMAIAVAIALLVLHVGSADLNEPFAYGGDANSAQMIVKDVIDHGWYQHNPDLGWPYGQDLRPYAFVSGDNLHVAIMGLFGLLGASPALAMNLFFLLGFALCALTAYLVLRAWRVSQIAAGLAAVLFAVLPYHFLHGETHVFISAYYSVPLIVWLVVGAWQGEPAFARGRRRLLLTGLTCVVIGSAHVYYAVFGILLIAVAAVVAGIAALSWRRAFACVLPALLILVVVGLNHAPNIAYGLSHDEPAPFARTFAESETYGLKIASMVLPVVDHRLEPLAHLRQRWDDGSSSQTLEGDPQALGLLATLGLVALLVVLALAAARRWEPPRLAVALALTAVVAILIGTVAGGSSLFALIVTPQLRAWARLSVLIAFCGLAALALALDLLRPRMRSRAALPLLGAALLVLGVLDQTTSAMGPDYRALHASWRSDAAFTKAIEQALPAGSPVFVLPYQAFPEPQIQGPPPAAAQPYDGLRQYLHSSRLKWSYGEIKGRHSDWQYRVAAGPATVLPAAVASVGFKGLVLDRGSYYNASTVERALERVLGPPRFLSAGRRFVFWDLRGVRGQGDAGARAATLDPLMVDWAEGFSGQKTGIGQSVRLSEQDAVLRLTNPGPVARTVRFSADIRTASGEPAPLEIAWPNGTQRIVLRGQTPVRRTLRIPPGTTAIHFNTSAPRIAFAPDIAHAFALVLGDAWVADVRQTRLVARPAPSPPATLQTPYGID